MPTTNRRKALKPAKGLIARQLEIHTLHVNDMFINIPGRPSCYFKRLRYRGCPTLLNAGKDFPSDTILVDMKRDNFIRECYQLMSENPTSSTPTRFFALIDYLRWVDSTTNEVIDGNFLSWYLIDKYMTWCVQQRALGLLNGNSFRQRKGVLSWLLKKKGRTGELKFLPVVKGIASETKSYPTLDLEAELKVVARMLFKSYNAFLRHFEDGSQPERHTLYDKNLVDAEAIKRNLQGRKLIAHHSSFSNVMKISHPNNHIIRIAMMITFMLTGMNYRPLIAMRIKDVSFKKVNSDRYCFQSPNDEVPLAILESVKARAKHQQQDNALGIKKYAMEFIKSWMGVANKMANGNDDAPLFPFYKINGEVIPYTKVVDRPHASINKLLNRMGLPKITSSIFRKTKADTLYRVTESVYLVAVANNNSIEVTARNYVHGTEKEHENNLSAAMTAKFDLAKGKSVDAAVEQAKFQFADVLDNYEYQRLREGKDRSHEARTPSGVRCNDNRKGASKVVEKVLKRVGIGVENDEVVCTDFLSCFDCQEHALVTDVDDIWLMLSFKETLQQLQQTPAINSMPEGKYIKLFNTIEVILNDFQHKNPPNYKQACERIKVAPHPLYDNVYSLDDLLGVFS